MTMRTKLFFGMLITCFTIQIYGAKDLKNYFKADKIHEIKNILEAVEKNEKAFSCLCDMMSERRHPDSNEKTRGAVTYVRWGRTNCSGNGTELMYSGYAAGDYYHSGKGSAASYLCLPKDPDWAKYQDSSQSAHAAKIYGAEYEMHLYTVGEALNKQYAQYEVPCAVCQNTKHSNVYMIPGKTRCYKGWSLEYRGYLMTQHSTHSPSEYVCVDVNQETIGEKSNLNGRLFYPVEAACCALKCPPYVANREITCAVCSR